MSLISLSSENLSFLWFCKAGYLSLTCCISHINHTYSRPFYLLVRLLVITDHHKSIDSSHMIFVRISRIPVMLEWYLITSITKDYLVLNTLVSRFSPLWYIFTVHPCRYPPNHAVFRSNLSRIVLLQWPHVTMLLTSPYTPKTMAVSIIP